MQKVSFRERLRYRVDNLMSRGPAPVVLGLFAITILVALFVSVFVYLAGWGSLGDPVNGGQDFTFPDIIWRAVLTTIDSGAVGNYTGTPVTVGFLLAMFAVTLVGIFFTSIFIGVLVTGIQARLDELRKGRSRVLETNQTVILGWSQQIFTVLSELVVANANQRRSAIVVLADRDKVEMEDAIKARVGDPGRTRIICRSGNPIDVTDLEIANIHTAKSIVILAPENDDPDADVLKTILAITNNVERRPEMHNIVAELREPSNLDVARMVGRQETELILVGDLIARIVAQTCRQSGLSVVYTELLDFEGDEIYFAPVPAALVGRPFGESLFAYGDSTVIGLMAAGGEPALNPPMDRVLAADDQLIAISEDDDTIRPAAAPLGGVRDDLIVTGTVRPRVPERTLIMGWNFRAPSVIRELDAYVAPGSYVLVVADLPDIAADVEAIRARLVHQQVDVRQGDTTDRALIDALHAETFDHIIILCYSDVLDVQRADARTLITLLHLRDIASIRGRDFSITSEMLDLRNRALAEVTQADDFIVSDRLISLLLSQVSENRHLKRVFDDLFDPAGSEIYLRPATDYVRPNEPMTFTTVVEAARRRDEIAIGYRRGADIENAARAYGVVINPTKSDTITFAAEDRVIVLAAGEGGSEQPAGASAAGTGAATVPAVPGRSAVEPAADSGAATGPAAA